MAPQIDFEKIVGGLLLGAGVGVGLALVNRLLKPLLPTPPVFVQNPRTLEPIVNLPREAFPLVAIGRSPALEPGTTKIIKSL